MRRKKTSDFEPQGPPRTCEKTGCGNEGLYRAPKSPERMDEYYWLCLDHIREYNATWDYFHGMSSAEIEEFRHDALFGHRPTWKISDQISFNRMSLEEALYRMMNEDGFQPHRSPATNGLSHKERHALATLAIEHPATQAQIKSRYKVLVKQYHPDVTKGDKELEETFKHVTAAYKYLMQHYKPPV